VPHDAHFLERLDRVRADETDLALGLYRDHELVRFILSHAKIPPEAERVAIALDAGVDGPWIVVARDGAFVTCLGRGMAARGLPIISRAQLDAWGEKHEEVRRRLAIAIERGAKKGHLPARLTKAGRWLTREDFIALTAVAAPIAGNLFSMYLEKVDDFNGSIPHAAVIGEPHTELAREVYTELAQSAWAMGHLALGITEGADREFLSFVLDVTEIVKGSTFAWTFLGDTLALPFFVRNAWCAAKMGKLALAHYKAIYARPTAPKLGHFEAAHALLAIAARHTNLRAEALKALEAQSPSDDEKVAIFRGWFRQAAELFERDPDAVLEGALAFGRHNFTALACDFAPDSKYRIEDPDLVPEDLARTAALNVWSGLSNANVFEFVPSLMLLAGRSKAEEFYYPADVARDLRVNRTLGEGIALAELHRSRFPPHTTVRAGAKPGRNDPCSCGSGKKYKKCCGAAL
jgi:SEC-C motif